LHSRLGHIYADAALAACKQFRITPRRVDLIGNHGQTVFHRAPRNSRSPLATRHSPLSSTLQIGEGAIIAARTGITTVSDFRPADMALGGNGAPLVPFADCALYRHPKLGRVSLNIGGIANVTVIPANAKPSQIFAFDTGPGNMLIDALISHFTHGRQHFDKNSTFAERGSPIYPMLLDLLKDPYFDLRPPKSTGREYFGQAYVGKLISLGHRYRAKPADVMHTVTLLTPVSIVCALMRFVLPKIKIDQVIVSEKGSQNPLIMKRLATYLSLLEEFPPSELARHVPPSALGKGRASRYLEMMESGPFVHSLPPGSHLSSIKVLLSDHFSVPTDAKESLAFALLAYETFHQRPSNIPSSTGAHGPAILGKISYSPPH